MTLACYGALEIVGISIIIILLLVALLQGRLAITG